MAKATKVSQKLIGLELETLSLLLHYWAMPESVKRRQANWKDKLPKFRSAVIAGMGQGSSERSTPHELVNSEYRIIHKSIKLLKSNHKGKIDAFALASSIKKIRIPFEFEKDRRKCIFERPIPILKENITTFTNALLGKGTTPSTLAYTITGKRLRCSIGKVKEAASAKAFKRTKLTEEQGLLASVFLDLCSLPEKVLPMDILTKILYVLFCSGCHLLVIFYLLKNAHSIEQKLFIGDYDYDKVEMLCDFVNSDKNKILEYQPFLRLLSK